MRGSLVVSASSTTTPPRSPIASPHSRASSSRGRMPVEMTTMSKARSSLFSKGDGCDFVVAEKALGAFAEQDFDPEGLHFPNQQR